MPSLSEKIQSAKSCCQQTNSYLTEKKKSFFEKLFDCEWEMLVIKKDKQTGKPVGKLACCSESIVLKTNGNELNAAVNG